MTTAEVFAEYLGLTPKNAPWAYGFVDCPTCKGRGMVSQPVIRAMQPCECGDGTVRAVTATSPLAPEPTPGWLEVRRRRGGRFRDSE